MFQNNAKNTSLKYKTYIIHDFFQPTISEYINVNDNSYIDIFQISYF